MAIRRKETFSAAKVLAKKSPAKAFITNRKLTNELKIKRSCYDVTYKFPEGSFKLTEQNVKHSATL